MKANPLKSALWSALFAFIGIFGAALVGFLGQVVDWANNGGTHAFPSLGGLALAAVSAAAAAVTGLVTFVIRWAQSKDYLPGHAPQFPAPAQPDQAGLGLFETIMFVALMLAVLALALIALT